MTVSQLTSTFHPTKSFWRLLSAKNHIILGARGSGKTALTRMLWHNHLCDYKEPKAQEAVRSKAFIGIYTTTRVEWVGGLKNKPWLDESAQERMFCWRLNLSCCLSFIVTAESCLRAYVPDVVERAKMERQISSALGREWIENESISTFRQLQMALEDEEAAKFSLLAKFRVTGDPTLLRDPRTAHFEAELFQPLKRGIQLLSRCLSLTDTTSWLLCLDEAEYLEPLHQRLINTYMRGAMGNLYFKVTTLPYLHHTLETNLAVPLNVGDDFEYVYIDQDPVILAGGQGKEGLYFAEQLFWKRAQQSGGKYRKVSLRNLLGPSPLLDQKDHDWNEGNSSWSLLQRFGSEATIARANKLKKDPKKFGNEIGRKILPALLLRDAVENISGRGELPLFCGEAFAVRCGDGNPRRLIRIFNSLLVHKAPQRYSADDVISMDPREQTRLHRRFAQLVLNGTQTEKRIGQLLFQLLNAAGSEMARRFYAEPLTTDQYYSITVDGDVSDEDWEVIKYGVAYGYLFPNINANNPDSVPNRAGTFRLAYCLAPAFKLIPRRGKAIALSEILQAYAVPKDSGNGLRKMNQMQTELPLG